MSLNLSKLVQILFRLFAVINLSACATNELIKDKEYSNTQALFRQSEFKTTLDTFPQKEKNGFITSVEKAWISLWSQAGDNSQLETQIKSLDQRKYTSLSREAEYFFYNESEDGYLPSEHEIIALHLINSMIYMQNKNWEDAEVEARRASYFLQNIFNPDQPHFDDPALRLWLAGLWMNLGQWNAAQVDLRRIYEMTSDPQIKKLMSLEKAPKFFRLYLNGSGPELKWSESSITPEFIINMDSSKKFLTNTWYQRHIKRNTALRDIVTESNYMGQYLGIKTNSNTQRVLGNSFGVASQFLGVVLGAAIIGAGIYVLAQSPATGSSGDGIGYVFLAGAAVGKFFWEQGSEIMSATNKGASEYEKNKFENLHTYRFIRLLPNQIDFELTKDSQKNQQSKLQFLNPTSAIEVEYILNP